MNQEATIENLINVIRKHQGIPQKKEITVGTLLEKDLGITGDDGCELLEAIEQEFGVSFIGADGTIREIFGLQKDEYLFHSEGIAVFNFLASLFGKDLERVKALTIGQLHEAVCRASNRVCRSQHSGVTGKAAWETDPDGQ
jgi:acyl carrier protein